MSRVWTETEPLILASQSLARQTLLRNAGLAFDAIPAEIDERAIQAASGLTEAGAIAALLAREKALAVSAQHPGRVVISADQTLALGRSRPGRGATARARGQHPSPAFSGRGRARWHHSVCRRLGRGDDDAAADGCRDRGLSRRGRTGGLEQRRRLSAGRSRRASVR